MSLYTAFSFLLSLYASFFTCLLNIRSLYASDIKIRKDRSDRMFNEIKNKIEKENRKNTEKKTDFEINKNKNKALLKSGKDPYNDLVKYYNRWRLAYILPTFLFTFVIFQILIFWFIKFFTARNTINTVTLPINNYTIINIISVTAISFISLYYFIDLTRKINNKFILLSEAYQSCTGKIEKEENALSDNERFEQFAKKVIKSLKEGESIDANAE